jgi:hypothetical protein
VSYLDQDLSNATKRPQRPPELSSRLLCDAAVARVVRDPLDRTRLELGRRRRLVSPAQRVALAVRDRGCCFPGCTARPQDCDAHHVIPWRDGGRTDLSNLALVCWHHHALLHEERWTLTLGPDGPRWCRPDGTLVRADPGWGSPPDRSVAQPGGRTDRRTGSPVRRARGRSPDPVEDLERRARERALALRAA